MAKVGKFCLAKRVKVEWLFQRGCVKTTLQRYKIYLKQQNYF